MTEIEGIARGKPMTITDDDRRAAAEILSKQLGDDIRAIRHWVDVKCGDADHDLLVQAFARHHLASERRAYERAAEVAQGYNNGSYIRMSVSEWARRSPFDHGQEQATGSITRSIRALIEGDG